MQTLLLPTSGLANKILELRVPMGLVQLDERPRTDSFSAGLTTYSLDPEPARQVPVILPLYYAGAYPQHYYNHSVNPDVKAKIDI